MEYYADYYQAPKEELVAVAKCESNFRKDALGDGGRAYSIFQYHRPTFDWFAQESGIASLSYESPHDQAQLTAWIWKYKPERKVHWTCAKPYLEDGLQKSSSP